MIAFVMNALAWEPVIKERHWFGLLEEYGNSPFHISINITNVNGTSYIESIEGYKEWDGQDINAGQEHFQPKTTYYSWLDHKLRFSLNVPNNWDINKNDGGVFGGVGLHNKQNKNQGTNFWIRNLKAGDQFNIEYYQGKNPNRNAFLNAGNVQRKIGDNVQTLTPGDERTGSRIDGIDGNELVFYTCGSDCDVAINIPGRTVIRSVTIIHATYQKATYETKQITENGNIGYETTLTGAGVLEEKRGAVPYITMRFGNENDMTFVRNLGVDGTGKTQFGAASIVDESNDFGYNSAQLQKDYSGYSADAMKKFISGKEWTIFTANNQLDGDEYHHSTYPLYGTYFYFFPEVDGKLHLKFFCEGYNEHMPLWVKTIGDEVIDWFACSDLNTNGSNYYEYTADVKKGGVYYLCSNPTIITHQHPVIRLQSYSFVPSFRVDPLYKVVGNGTTSVSGAATIKGVTIDRFEGTSNVNGEYVFDNNATVTINGESAPMIKFLGNVKKEGTVIKLRQDGNDIKLDFQNIAFKDGDDINNGDDINKGGAIVVNLECPAGEAGFVLTVAYDAAEAKWDANGTLRVPATDGGTQVKHWDFYSGKGEKDALGTGQGWDLGKYGAVSDNDENLWKTDFNSWKQKSKLFKEVNKHGGLTADWVDTYVNLADGKNERIFKSVYDMEGDNADMIHETAGLVFLTHANQLGIMNENDEPIAQFQDRYVGLMPGSKFSIPLLDAGDRIVIKMGTYHNENVTLNITGANDAINTPISSDYVIGGSTPVSNDVTGADDKYYPRGEYHFVAKGGDATFEVKSGQMLKIYSIDIYKNDDILTENQLIGNVTEVTFTDDDAATATKTFDAHVRYHGYQEKSDFDNVDQLRGNLAITKDKVTVTTSDEEPYCTISTTVKKGDFGSFRAKMEVLTKDANNTYVTDYVPGSLAVGLLEKVKDGYPYTWDFTDLLKLEYNNSTYIHDAIDFEKAATNLLSDFKGWELYNGESLRNAPKNASGVLFADGGQLYAKNEMFKETAGIGFKRSTDNVEDAKLLNRSVRVRDGAIILNCNEDGVFHKMVIPKVPANGVVYVRATPIENAKYKAQCSKDGLNGDSFDKTLTVGDDKVFIMKNNAEQNLELWLNGYEIKKIAVATDEKTVNDEGWNTESRDHAIDPSLLPYMTGMDFRTYAVFDTPTTVEGENIIKLTRIDGVSKDDDVTDTGNAKIIGAAEDDSPNACIIRKVDSRDLFEKTVDGKTVKYFHLFAPDMHDGPSVMTNNLLKARLTPTSGTDVVPRQSGDFYNYAFTNKYKYVDGDGEQLQGREGVYTGKQAFYLIMASGASSAGNQAYLSLDTKVPAARLLLFFEDEEEENGEATGIAAVEKSIGGENARFYNLNGQQLSGKPNRSGLYIVNGKKVSIKNK